jgi:hypothetical protein
MGPAKWEKNVNRPVAANFAGPGKVIRPFLIRPISRQTRQACGLPPIAPVPSGVDNLHVHRNTTMSRRFPLPPSLAARAAALLAFFAAQCHPVSGQVLLISNSSTGTIGEYDPNTGSAINASLMTGVPNPYGLAVSGSKLFVATTNNDRVAEYDVNTGHLINNSFIVGGSSAYPYGLAASGNTLYVSFTRGPPTRSSPTMRRQAPRS